MESENIHPYISNEILFQNYVCFECGSDKKCGCFIK